MSGVPNPEQSTVEHTVERRTAKWEPASADKVDTFCSIMKHPDAPVSFNIQVMQRLKDWGLIEGIDLSIAQDYDLFRQTIGQAREKTAKEGLDDQLFETNPWNFDGCIEGEYSEDELPDKFPTASMLKESIGEQVKFAFRAEPGEFYLRLVIREDGRRQVIRVVNTERSIEEINADAANLPSIIPDFEAVKLKDGRTTLLIEWIDGEMPKSSEEKALCLTHAEELLRVPIDSYDLWAGNFVLDAQSNVYYIDKDIPETIAQSGYSETTDERRTTFEQNKEKMR